MEEYGGKRDFEVPETQTPSLASVPKGLCFRDLPTLPSRLCASNRPPLKGNNGKTVDKVRYQRRALS